MPLQAAEWEAVNRSLTSLYRELDQDQYFRQLLRCLHDLVPADSLAINIAPVGRPHEFSAIILPENHATSEQVALIGKYAHQSPFASYYQATQDSNWKMATDFMPVEDFHNTDLHRLALSPLGINHQMFGVLGKIEDVGYAIAINRTNSSFTERDRKVLNTIHPHLVTSFINATVYSRAKRSIAEITEVADSAPGAYGYLDRDGRVNWIQDRGAAWLNEFFGELDADGQVPRPIRKLLDRSAKQNDPQSLENDRGPEKLTVCLGPSALGGWILRLDRQRKTPPLHFRPMPQLGKRQNEVLKWMVEGKRNAEIATILNLSPRTIENHVQRILRDLMVENRATAIVCAIEFCANANLKLSSDASKSLAPVCL